MQQIKAKGRSGERMHDPLQPSRRHRQLRVAKTDDEQANNGAENIT